MKAYTQEINERIAEEIENYCYAKYPHIKITAKTLIAGGFISSQLFFDHITLLDFPGIFRHLESQGIDLICK